MNVPDPQTHLKHHKSSLPELQTLIKHIYSSHPAQIQLRSNRSPHEIQTQLKSIHAHFMPIQNRAICSDNLPRLFCSPLILSHDGSAAAAAAHKSAAPNGGRGVSEYQYSCRYCRYLQFSDEIRVPPARRSRRPTGSYSVFCLNFCLRVRVFDALFALGYAFLTPRTSLFA